MVLRICQLVRRLLRIPKQLELGTLFRSPIQPHTGLRVGDTPLLLFHPHEALNFVMVARARLQVSEMPAVDCVDVIGNETEDVMKSHNHKLVKAGTR